MTAPTAPPPGEGPNDPYIKDIDALGFSISRALCHLVWADEHAASFVKLREAESALADQELKYLKHSTTEALKHMRRLRDPLLSGYTFDPVKRLPEGLAEQ